MRLSALTVLSVIALCAFGASLVSASYLPTSEARRVTRGYAKRFYYQTSGAYDYGVGECKRKLPSKVICDAVVYAKQHSGPAGSNVQGLCYYPIQVTARGGYLYSKWTGGIASSALLNCF
jgi:hypothetical protein